MSVAGTRVTHQAQFATPIVRTKVAHLMPERRVSL